MRYFNPDGLGQPLGLYSHVSESTAGRVLCIAGQVGISREGTLAGNDLDSQLRQTIENVQTALHECNASLDEIAMMTTYLIEADDIPHFMDARQRIFPDYFGTEPYPPNTLLVVARLVDPRFRIEVQALAITSSA